MPRTYSQGPSLTVTEHDAIGRTGNHLWLWRVTLGDGTRAGYSDTEEEGYRRAKRARKILMAVESHGPDEAEIVATVDDEMAAKPGYTLMRAPDGNVIPVADGLVAAAMESSYTPVQEPEQPKRKPGRPRKTVEAEDEMG